MAIGQQGLTLQEFLALPEQKPALEYIAGKVSQKVAPKPRHSRLQTKLPEYINQFAEPRALAAAFTELQTSFGGRSPVPDVVVSSWARLPVDADGELLADCSEPPDLAIEIVSPGQSIGALAEVCAWYVANDVRLALLVHPAGRWVRRFDPQQPPTTLRGQDVLDFGPVVPGLTLRVDDLFGLLRMRR